MCDIENWLKKTQREQTPQNYSIMPKETLVVHRHYKQLKRKMIFNFQEAICEAHERDKGTLSASCSG
jgi:hypothetical protein